MPNKKHSHDEVIAIYDQLIASIPDLQRKGAKSNYTSINGHMFSFVDPNADLALRYSEADKKALMEKYCAKESIQHNSVMRGYIIVPDMLLGNTNLMLELFQKSYDYISSLKPKPSKKKSK